jgi:hypothetical protein
LIMAVEKKARATLHAMRGLLTNLYLSLASRLVLGGVFLYAGAAKVFDPGGLAASIRSYGLGLPEWFVTLSAHATTPARGAARALPARGPLCKGLCLGSQQPNSSVSLPSWYREPCGAWR